MGAHVPGPAGRTRLHRGGYQRPRHSHSAGARLQPRPVYRGRGALLEPAAGASQRAQDPRGRCRHRPSRRDRRLCGRATRGHCAVQPEPRRGRDGLRGQAYGSPCAGSAKAQPHPHFARPAHARAYLRCDTRARGCQHGGVPQDRRRRCRIRHPRLSHGRGRGAAVSVAAAHRLRAEAPRAPCQAPLAALPHRGRPIQHCQQAEGTAATRQDQVQHRIVRHGLGPSGPRAEQHGIPAVQS
mmetsp:Transcript_73055/g.176289  ORF Transcript_73055/g.176289 Transcript_73055/m.176289 type:complete len:240 (-) Transcript_73055:80-799(-)